MDTSQKENQDISNNSNSINAVSDNTRYHVSMSKNNDSNDDTKDLDISKSMSNLFKASKVRRTQGNYNHNIY